MITADLDTLLRGELPQPFGHREHLAAALAAVDRFGSPAGEMIMRGALKAAATKAGAVAKYHDTMTMFWFGLVVYVAATHGAGSVDELATAAPVILDQRAPFLHWSRERLLSDAARSAWVPPDLQPVPWETAD